MVDASPVTGPASRTRSQAASRPPSTSSTDRGASPPLGLALEASSGNGSSPSARAAAGHAGTRTPSVATLRVLTPHTPCVRRGTSPAGGNASPGGYGSSSVNGPGSRRRTASRSPGSSASDASSSSTDG